MRRAAEKFASPMKSCSLPVFSVSFVVNSGDFAFLKRGSQLIVRLMVHMRSTKAHSEESLCYGSLSKRCSFHGSPYMW